MIQQQARSATIYQFPVGGRDGLRERKAETLPRTNYAVGESWYHAEAILDDAKPAKPQ